MKTTQEDSLHHCDILIQAYIVAQACSFLQPFRHNFTENGRQDLKWSRKTRLAIPHNL
jgi:hypothetical protein